RPERWRRLAASARGDSAPRPGRGTPSDVLPAPGMERDGGADRVRAGLSGEGTAPSDGTELPGEERPVLLRLVHSHDPRQRRPLSLLFADVPRLRAAR